MGINFFNSHVWIGQKKDLHFPNWGFAGVVVDIIISFCVLTSLSKALITLKEMCSRDYILAHLRVFSREKSTV
jgi:hypothetical protein